MTERVGAFEAERNWGRVIKRAFGGEVRFVVEEHGTRVAGTVSADDVARLAELSGRRGRDFGVLRRLGQAFRDETVEQIEDAVDKTVAEMRAENRGEQER